VRDHNPWLCLNLLAPVPVVQIVNESPGGAIDVKKIHRIRADAREFRPLTFARVARFMLKKFIAFVPTQGN